MHKIELKNIGRRFNKHWIFRAVDYTFIKGESYAILGSNGSGKSTLMQVVSGSLSPSEGELYYQNNSGKEIAVSNVYTNLVYVAPYIELIEDFTYREAITFHFKFKPLLKGYQYSDIFDCLNLPTHQDKEVKYFSSGMKQRLKLALAFFSDVDVLLLDEPTSNLDRQGESWYLSLCKQFTSQKLVLVSSNQEVEYEWCNHKIHIEDYKVKK